MVFCRINLPTLGQINHCSWRANCAESAANTCTRAHVAGAQVSRQHRRLAKLCNFVSSFSPRLRSDSSNLYLASLCFASPRLASSRSLAVWLPGWLAGGKACCLPLALARPPAARISEQTDSIERLFPHQAAQEGTKWAALPNLCRDLPLAKTNRDARLAGAACWPRARCGTPAGQAASIAQAVLTHGGAMISAH